MDLNFFGTLKFIHPVVKRMLLRKTKGRVVLVGDSLSPAYAIPGMSPYSISKAAIDQLAYQLKNELECQDIKVHYFLPPPMETPMM